MRDGYTQYSNDHLYKPVLTDQQTWSKIIERLKNEVTDRDELEKLSSLLNPITNINQFLDYIVDHKLAKTLTTFITLNLKETNNSIEGVSKEALILLNLLLRSNHSNLYKSIVDSMISLSTTLSEPVSNALLNLYNKNNKSFSLNIMLSVMSLKAEDKDGNTLLHWAVQADNIPSREIDKLSKRVEDHSKFIDPNVENYDGVTPLHLAAQEGRLAVIDVLLRNQAVLDTPDMDGNTPIHYAAKRNQRIVTHLIYCGADPKLKNREGFTAAQLLAKRYKAHSKVAPLATTSKTLEKINTTHLVRLDLPIPIVDLRSHVIKDVKRHINPSERNNNSPLPTKKSRDGMER